MSRLVRTPVSFFGLALLFVGFPMWWMFRPPRVAAQIPGAPAAVTITAVEKHVALRHAGLDAQTLAAAGLSSAAATTLGQAAAQHLASNYPALRAAEAACATARRESDRLLRLIQAGKATSAEVAAHATAKTALTNAEGTRDAALTALFQAATAGLTQQQRALLSTIRANAANREVPVPYRTLTRTKQEWLQLRDDLASERISLKQGTELFAPGQARLAAVRANATFASANTALATNLAAVTTAMNTTLGSPSNH